MTCPPLLLGWRGGDHFRRRVACLMCVTTSINLLDLAYLLLNIICALLNHFSPAEQPEILRPNLRLLCSPASHFYCWLVFNFLKLKSKKKIFHSQNRPTHLLLSEVSLTLVINILSKERLKIHWKSMISRESFIPWGWNLKLKMKVNQFQILYQRKWENQKLPFYSSKLSFSEWFFKDVEGRKE